MTDSSVVDFKESATEYTAKYSKVVASVQDAFAFVMSHLDKVGPEPSVWIDPAFEHGVDEFTGDLISRSVFVVTVAGMVEI